jgi:hypothetical protein
MSELDIQLQTILFINSNNIIVPLSHSDFLDVPRPWWCGIRLFVVQFISQKGSTPNAFQSSPSFAIVGI